MARDGADRGSCGPDCEQPGKTEVIKNKIINLIFMIFNFHLTPEKQADSSCFSPVYKLQPEIAKESIIATKEIN